MRPLRVLKERLSLVEVDHAPSTVLVIVQGPVAKVTNVGFKRLNGRKRCVKVDRRFQGHYSLLTTVDAVVVPIVTRGFIEMIDAVDQEHQSSLPSSRRRAAVAARIRRASTGSVGDHKFFDGIGELRQRNSKFSHSRSSGYGFQAIFRDQRE